MDHKIIKQPSDSFDDTRTRGHEENNDFVEASPTYR